jgi:cytochrome P450
VLADQRAAYDNLRERCPVAHSDAMHWSLFRHADVVAALHDPDTFVNASRHHAIPNAMNGQEHTIHRDVLAQHFTTSRMKEIEPRCRAIAAEVIRSLPRTGIVDAVADIAEPISLRMMCAFLGWPEDLWTRVQQWLHGNRAATFHQDRNAARELALEYAAIVTTALEDHRRRGIENDVTGRLLATEIGGVRWSDEDIIDTLRNWIAGHGTVSAALGIVLAHLAEDQDLQRRLREQPQLIPVAIDEIPRVYGPLVSNARTPSRDATINGRTIPAGERVSLMWIAANRDSRVFDAPQEIRLDRDQQQNLLYGAGIHYCLGAPLARLELTVVLETLFAATTEFLLASDEALKRETFPGNGFVSVPVRIA